MSEYNCRVQNVAPKEGIITKTYVSPTGLMESGITLVGGYRLVFTRFREVADADTNLHFKPWKPWYLDYSISDLPREVLRLPVPEWIDSRIDWVLLNMLPPPTSMLVKNDIHYRPKDKT